MDGLHGTGGGNGVVNKFRRGEEKGGGESQELNCGQIRPSQVPCFLVPWNPSLLAQAQATAAKELAKDRKDRHLSTLKSPAPRKSSQAVFRSSLSSFSLSGACVRVVLFATSSVADEIFSVLSEPHTENHPQVWSTSIQFLHWFSPLKN